MQAYCSYTAHFRPCLSLLSFCLVSGPLDTVIIDRSRLDGLDTPGNRYGKHPFAGLLQITHVCA